MTSESGKPARRDAGVPRGADGDARTAHAPVLTVAEDIGLDPTQLQADMETSALKAIIERNHTLAQALGIDGTPAFVVGTEVVMGSTDIKTLKALVARARQGE